MSNHPTKERILDAAEKLMLENSFHSVGLAQILKAVNVPKGSFYHHFGSKEDFGIELLKHYVADASACKRARLLEPGLDAQPIERLFLHLEAGLAKFQAGGGRCPCLIIKLASEVSSLREGMRQVLAEGFDEWVSIYVALLEQARDAGQIPRDFDCERHGQLIHDLCYGAAQRAIACRSIRPLRNAVDSLKEILRVPSLA